MYSLPRLLACLVVFAGVGLPQPCNPVRFVTTPSAMFAGRTPTSMAAGLERRPDGSYTRRDYFWAGGGLTPAAVTVGAVTDAFDRQMYGCSGFPSPDHQPVAGFRPLASNQLGVSSSNPVFADLTGDGRLTGMGIERRLAGGALIVGTASANLEPAEAAIAYPVGPQPIAVLTADFNGDSRLDAAVVYSGGFDGTTPGGVSILLNDGSGGFRAALNTALPQGAFTATAGDWDKDGRVDIAVSRTGLEGAVYLLKGRGDGRFETPALLGNVFAVRLIAADLTGDGRDELIAIGSVNSGFAYFPGTANGFGPPVNVDVGLFNPFGGVAADFNRDGRVDVALFSFSAGVIAVALNEGGGRFRLGQGYAVGPQPENLFAMDFDGDGLLDLVLGSGHPDRLGPNPEFGQIAVLRGRGDGSFIGAPMLISDRGPTGVATADFNRDGRLDIVFSEANRGYSISFGGAAGGFGEPRRTAIADGGASGVAVGDFNADGRPDLAMTNSTGRVLIALGRADGTFPEPARYTAIAGAAFPVVADFNGDRRDDVAVLGASFSSTSPQGVAVLTSNADGTMAAARTIALPASFRARDLAAADLNSDGRPDLIAVDIGTHTIAAGGVHVLLAAAGGAFQAPVRYAAGDHPVAVEPIDLEGDGDLDLLVSTQAAGFAFQIAILRGSGNGVFAPDGSLRTDFGPGAIAATDLNDDGLADLVITHCCGSVQPTYMLGEGGGRFQPEVRFDGGADTTAVLAADFNADDKPDLAFLNTPTGSGGGVTVLLNASEAPAPVHVSAASFEAGPLAPDMLASAFGSGVAPRQESAASTPLPMTLGGTKITIADSSGARHAAGLIFAGPGQINYWLPPAVAEGPADLIIEPDGAPVQTSRTTIARVAPGLFFLNADRLAAAIVLRVAADGAQTVENVYVINPQTQAVEARPIPLGAEGERLFLLLFGTGFRRISDPGQAGLTIGGVAHPIAYVGPEGGGAFFGLDQVNTEINRSLAGRGLVDVRLEVEGKAANSVRLRFQ